MTVLKKSDSSKGYPFYCVNRQTLPLKAKACNISHPCNKPL